MGRKRRIIAWNKFGKLTTKYELDQYLLGYEYNHTKFFHYSNLKNINSILEKHAFHLSNVSRFNDKMDSKQFGTETDYFFSLCFSTGINENLSLWYLYSGINGQGGRIVFTPAYLEKMITEGEYSLCKYQKIENDKDIEIYNTPLYIHKDMDIVLQDVIYYQESDCDPGYMDLKYNTMTNHKKISVDEFDKYKVENTGFCKNLIWYYEKETRLLVHLANPELRTLVSGLDKENEYFVIQLKFNKNIYKNLSIGFAPEVIDPEKLYNKYEYLEKFNNDTGRTAFSQYKGQLEMDLCKNCEFIKDDKK